MWHFWFAYGKITELGVCKKHLMHITLPSFQKHCSSFSFGYSDISKFIMVNKTECFPKLIPTSWHKPVYLSEIQTKYLCLHYIGSLGCLWKKELTKFVKKYQSESERKCYILQICTYNKWITNEKESFFSSYIKTNNV